MYSRWYCFLSWWSFHKASYVSISTYSTFLTFLYWTLCIIAISITLINIVEVYLWQLKKFQRRITFFVYHSLAIIWTRRTSLESQVCEYAYQASMMILYSVLIMLIDPHVLFSRGLDRIYTTEVITKTCDPVWQPFIVSVERLCNNDPDVPVKVSCWDWDKVIFRSIELYIWHCF
jgi:hypothetical protein